MSKEREAELAEQIARYKHTEVAVWAVELLTLRRERWRDKLEGEENAEVRGKAKECKDLLQLFS